MFLSPDKLTSRMTLKEMDKMAELIQSLTKGGMSVIVVEHDINFVRRIAEWITVLHNGAVFTEGSVNDIEADEDVKRIYLGEE